VVDVDLTALVSATAEVWQARCAAKDVPYRVEAVRHPVLVRADPRRLRQVLDGLTENALHVTPAGRPIVLSLSLSVAPGRAVVRVRDGGPGCRRRTIRWRSSVGCCTGSIGMSDRWAREWAWRWRTAW
jgi:C4-dicarboxylate-specific signal transduction histidine kinase